MEKQLKELQSKLSETMRDQHVKLLEANAAQTRLAAELDRARIPLPRAWRVAEVDLDIRSSPNRPHLHLREELLKRCLAWEGSEGANCSRS